MRRWNREEVNQWTLRRFQTECSCFVQKKMWKHLSRANVKFTLLFRLKSEQNYVWRWIELIWHKAVTLAFDLHSISNVKEKIALFLFKSLCLRTIFGKQPHVDALEHIHLFKQLMIMNKPPPNYSTISDWDRSLQWMIVIAWIEQKKIRQKASVMRMIWFRFLKKCLNHLD